MRSLLLFTLPLLALAADELTTTSTATSTITVTHYLLDGTATVTTSFAAETIIELASIIPAPSNLPDINAPASPSVATSIVAAPYPITASSGFALLPTGTALPSRGRPAPSDAPLSGPTPIPFTGAAAVQGTVRGEC